MNLIFALLVGFAGLAIFAGGWRKQQQRKSDNKPNAVQSSVGIDSEGHSVPAQEMVRGMVPTWQMMLGGFVILLGILLGV